MTRRYTCAHCAAVFATITEHMSHVVTAHDTGMVPATSDRRLRRSSACWRCAAEIPATADRCSCGAPHPRLR